MTTRRVIALTFLITGTLGTTPGTAADVPIAGSKLKMADATQPGTARRKVVFAARDASIVVPGDGSAGDPTLYGGSVEIANTAGSGESQTIALPSANWRRTPSDPAKPLRGWKYKDVLADPPADDYKVKVALKQTYSGAVLRIVLKDDRGSLVAYTLDEAMQGSVGIRLGTGTDRLCADFGGTIVADASEDLGDGVYRGRFVAKAAPTPPDCGSPGGAFVD